MNFVELIKDTKARERRLRVDSNALTVTLAQVPKSSVEHKTITQLVESLTNLAEEERDAAVVISRLALAHSDEDFEDVLKALGS